MKFRCLVTLVIFLGLHGNGFCDEIPLTEQVLITAGSFTMGKEGSDNKTSHEVTLSAFYLDATEVTNAQYHAFCLGTERKLPVFWGLDRFRSGPNFPSHPVIGVNHTDA